MVRKICFYVGFLLIIKSIKRELKTRPIYDCRCDERLEPKYDELKFFYFIMNQESES